ncbi:hypothetical protein DICVIV_13215 [Dictyocaulus viviparus]|uniref:Uncharacterized protein n=1 Tax=Dictyocaulus viviparus TaxID=29172 RepID=A0A0D8X8C9_DICVI|nr:hypothetical protein DICVIV_13215 [Dictyocaulus viviparus]
MRWSLIGGIMLVVVSPSLHIPLSKALAVNDLDLILMASSSNPNKDRQVRTHSVLQDEVKDIPSYSGNQTTDDYIDFAIEPLKNGGANRNLKPVTYSPIPKKYDIPTPEQETDTSGTLNGYYYQHYPYYQLPRQYQLRPQYAYTYPPQHSNVAYIYHDPLPYRDHYNIYRSDPRFNPVAAVGCGATSSCEEKRINKKDPLDDLDLEDLRELEDGKQ